MKDEKIVNLVEKFAIGFYLWMQEKGYEHNLKNRVEKRFTEYMKEYFKNIENTEIKKGTKLIAIDECIMEFENVPSLIIGNTYEITGVFSNYFTISSHQHKEHEFNICELNHYFQVKS